ncbi:AAA family ATPase [Pseudomonas sp. MAG002Y]|nr:AAA family ATPase [Pseudomonas sp. MAG002Y]
MGMSGQVQQAPLDEAWLQRLSWQPFDAGRTHRFSVRDPLTGETWLACTAALRSDRGACQRLEREFALRHVLQPEWALVPVAYISTQQGPALLLDHQHGQPVGPLAPDGNRIECFIVRALAATHALVCLHAQGLLHQDIKPDHFVQVSDSGIRLTGFGNAISLSQAEAPRSSALQGTIDYMSPEQLHGAQGCVDVRSDLYALGMTFYEWLTGRLPFSGSDAVEWFHSHLARQPAPPSHFGTTIPPVLDQIILTLIAKNPAERYQTAKALSLELECCLEMLRQPGRSTFSPSITPILNMRDTFVGREQEIGHMAAALDRIRRSQGCEFILIEGTSGTGKSALVRQFASGLRSHDACFIEGKFDQLKQTPFSPLVQALNSLVIRAMGEGNEQLSLWRHCIDQALGKQVGLLMSIIPDLYLITGPVTYTPSLPSYELHARLNEALVALLAVFASPKRPLILFLDDLQWLDTATLTFILHVVRANIPNLLFVGAYRENDARLQSEFQTFLQQLTHSLSSLTTLPLRPLSLDETGKLIEHYLKSGAVSINLLAGAVQDKTGGNPFFTQQLIRHLLEEKRLEQKEGHWQWNLGYLEQHHYADNVIDLMLSRLERLPSNCLSLLQTLALMGNDTPLATLAGLNGLSANDAQHQLQPALNASLVNQQDGRYRLSHDRIQEAVYCSIPEAQRLKQHARVACYLIDLIDTAGQPESRYAIASQILRAGIAAFRAADYSLIITALLNAARCAKAAAATHAALEYLQQAEALMDAAHHPMDDQRRALNLLYLQCLLLSMQLEVVPQRLELVLAQLTSPVERAEFHQIGVELRGLQSDYQGAVDVAVIALKELGIDLANLSAPWDVIDRWLDTHGIESVLHLPLMANDAMKPVVGLLSSMIIPATVVDAELSFRQQCHLMLFTLKHGMTGAGAEGMAWLGVLIAQRHGSYAKGYELARTALRVVEQHGFHDARAAVLVPLDQVSVWTQPIEYALDYARQACSVSYTEGNLTISSYACMHIVFDLMVAGKPLSEVQEHLELARSFTDRIGFRDVQLAIQYFEQYIRQLGIAYDPCAPARDGIQSETTIILFWGALLQGISAYHFGYYADAQAALAQAAQLSWSVPAHIHLIDLHVFQALTYAALAGACPLEQTLAAIEPHRQQLKVWADINPNVFKDKATLIDAECARIAGDGLNALTLYEKAAMLAGRYGFTPIQALAHELAARHCLVHDLHVASQGHLDSAKRCYQAWGAHAKAALLEKCYPWSESLLPGKSATPIEGQESLDLISVLKASQALSQELELDNLIARLMTNTLIHAGAQRGVLLFVEHEQAMVAASSWVEPNQEVAIDLIHEPAKPEWLPLSILNTAIKSKQPVVLTDTRQPSRFSGDPYFADHEVRSLLCLPLLKQGEVVGALYLENSLMPGVFTQERTQVLELLAAQAAISLQTARLYEELVAENQRRQAVEMALRESESFLKLGQQISNIGIYRWNPITDEAVWTSEMYALFGVIEGDVPPGYVGLWNLIHPDDLAGFQAHVDMAVRAKRPYRYEIRITTPQGLEKRLETMGHLDGETYIGAVIDLTEVRATESELRNARAELTRAAQATILGELAASIAHEINQPLASIVSNASAGIRWLDRPLPELSETRESLEEIAKEGKRAGDIVHALRSLTKQTTPDLQPLPIDEVIATVLRLISSEIEHRHVMLTSRLTARSVKVLGDRILLQQVVLNLVNNAIEAMLQASQPPCRLEVCSNVVGSEYVVVSIEDTGVGIPDTDLGQLFDAFFSTKSSGMGMGLAICRSVIQSHGGSIHAYAARKRGSVFVFTLPLAE